MIFPTALGGDTPDRVHIVVTHVCTLSSEVLRGECVWKLGVPCYSVVQVKNNNYNEISD
jgi:hypothetical protein